MRKKILFFVKILIFLCFFHKNCDSFLFINKLENFNKTLPVKVYLECVKHLERVYKLHHALLKKYIARKDYIN